MKGGLVPMNKYVITKQLTKRPEDYPDAKNQAHVQVAMRRKAAGKRDGVVQVRLPVSLFSRRLYMFSAISSVTAPFCDK